MGTRPALRSLEYWAYQYKRTWRATLATGFLTPALYLAAMGLGLGTLVNRHSATTRLGGVSYLVYLAPGLMAAAAMQAATIESTWPVFGGIKWTKTYHAMLATPLRVADVLYGHVCWMAVRVLLVSMIFLGVMSAFGAPRSPEVLAAVPVAVLTGLAFATPFAGYVATRQSDQAIIAIFRFLVIPMFLFSGTFFPVSQLPAGLRPLAWITPLWHGVSLCRSLSLGDASLPAALGHLAYLIAVIVVGLVVARRTFTRRLAN